MGEVGVRGDVERELRGHADLEVDPTVELLVIHERRTVAGIRDQERLDLEIPPLTDALDALEGARHRSLEDPEWSGRGGPLDPLVPTARDALDVEAPRLRGVLTEPKGLERDHELGRPAPVPNLRGHVEDAVPVLVGDAARDLLIPHGGTRIGREGEPVPVIVEGVEEQHDRVAVERSELAPELADDDGILLEGRHRDVDVLLVVEDPEFGPFGRGHTVLRIGLIELAPHLGPVPGGLVHHAIEPDRLVRPRGPVALGALHGPEVGHGLGRSHPPVDGPRSRLGTQVRDAHDSHQGQRQDPRTRAGKPRAKLDHAHGVRHTPAAVGGKGRSENPDESGVA